jgi:RHS repeat-associated protein
MDTTKIDTNSLLNLGVDPNLHPLLASTSILPSVLPITQTQLYAPVDPLLVGYVTPIATANSSLLVSNPIVQPIGSQNSLTTQIATALSPTTVTKDPLFNNKVVTASLSTTVAAPIHPATPTLQLAASSDTGASNSDQITKINTPTITGTGDVGTKIKLSDGNTVIGQTTVGSDGKWQVTTDRLSNGNHQLTAIANDSAGRISTTSTQLGITIDNLAPKIQTDDSFGSTVNSKSKLAGKIDGTGSTAGLTYQWDNRTPIAVSVTNEGEFEQSFDLTGLTSGTHTLTLTSTDLAGNSSTKTASVKVLLPVQPPTISTQLTHDTAPGGAVNTDKITADPQIQGKVTSTVTKFLAGFDSTATSKYVSILPQLQADGSFSLNRATLDKIFGKSLTDGTHTLHLIATASQPGGEDDDRAEGGGSKTTTSDFTFTLDTLAPQFTVTSPLATSPLKNNAKLTGTANGTGSNLASISYVWDNSTTAIAIVPNATGSFDQLLDFTGITNGTHKLTLTATDLAGNVTTNSYNTTVAVDREAPVITAKLTTDTGVSNSDKITSERTISGKVTDASGIGALKAGFNTTPTANWSNVTTSLQPDGSFTFTPTQLNQIYGGTIPDGTHTLHLSATDTFGNQSQFDYTFTLDTLAPQLTLTTPLDTNPLQNNAKIVGSLDGTGSNLTSINYRWDNSTTLIPIVPNATGGFNQGLDFTGINNGTHTITITATDVAGNVLTSNYNVNVNLDKVAPIVNLQLATDSGSSISDKITNNPTITGKVTDVSGVSAVTVSLNAGFTNSINITASLQPDGTFSLNKATLTQLNGGTLPDGNYQVYLQAIDTFGNTTTPQTLAFQLLTQATLPTNLQLAASNDTGTSNSDGITKNNQPTIQGNGKAGDTIQLLEGTTLLGQTIVGTDGKWQIASTTLSDGSHNLTAQTIDLAGNTSPSSTALSINIDTVVPNLQLAQQLAGIVLTGTSHLAGQVTDTNINTISYQFDGATPINLPNFAGGTPGNFDTPFDFTGINDGGHNLTVSATDIAGNSVSHTYGVTVARGNLLTIALLDDTGISNTDGITSDINVRGQVADRHQISRLEFALDGSTNYTDLTAALQLDGTFRLLPAQLNSLAGGTLSFGAHSLTAIGVLADGTPVATATLNFTYQSANLNRPSLALNKASDTGVIGDLVTSATTVDLIAKAAAGTSVKLGTQTLIADANGIATFTGINLTLGGNNFTLTTTDSNGELATSTTTITRTNPDDVILTWNHIALAAIQRENTPPPAAARVLGMVHTAMYDAVNAIEQKYGVYRVDASAPTGADEIAAAAEAAARVLAAIYPNQQAYFSAALDSSLLDGATAAAKADGVALGDTVATNIITWRQQDGSRNPAAFNPSTDIGDWQPDLPNYDGALLPQWGKVTTFGLTSGSQFRPAGDPSLTSAVYTTAFNETKDYGSRDSTLRTADQTQSALFWSDGSGTYTPAGHWNDIAATAASVSGKSLLDNARLFAQLNVALADAGIAAWDAKYTFDAWRPITAIRQADKDGNPLTSADPNWVPLLNTPPFPEYVSGHSTFSAAAAAVLDNTFGSTFSFNSGSIGLPNVTRSFTSFDAAAAEAGQSRIYGGIHFQFSNQDGLALGKQIGDYVAKNLLLNNSLNSIQASLTNDTAAFGTTNHDRITNQVGITGKVNLSQPNLKLQVGQANGTFVDITSSLDPSGNFQLDATKLSTILGTLTDKSYQLTFKLVDSTGAVISSNNLSFILDTTAAQATLNPLTGTVTPTVHLTGTATDSNGGTSGRFKVDGGTWTSFAVGSNGTFNKVINAQGLTAGAHTVNVELADLAGNITAQTVSFNVDTNNNIYASPATNPGWGRVFGTRFSLAEGNSLVTQNSIDVALGGSGKRTLDFDLTASFDKSDVKSFGKDRVAVYLVDSSNNPIAIDSTHPGGTPLFSLSETGSEIIPGLVKFDGTHVQIDVSNIAATSGKLVVQLLNQDGDTGSNLTVTNLVDNIDPNGIAGTSVSPAIQPVNPGAAKILDSYLATNNAQLLLSNVSLDKATGKYTADLRVQNVGTTTLSQNLVVLLTGLPTGVTVANSSGIHPAGAAYLNFDTAIAPGGLAGGAISDAMRVVINDPSLAAFSFKPVVLQGAAAPLPDLSSLKTLTVKVGDKIDIPLAGELAIKTTTKLPTGAITGDSHLVFTPSPDQVGSYTFTLIARNGGTEVTQNVTLNVVADPITTTRVTGIIADVNQAGLANVLVELAGYQATTDVAGKFTIVLPESSAGDTLKIYGQRIQGGGVTYPFIAEKMGLLLGHDIYRGVNNQIDRPIYLPTIDMSTGTTVNPGAETFVTNPKLVGAKVDVAAGSLFDKSGNAFAGIMTITEVPTSLTPAALPENLHPDLVVTIQPGDMVFNTPAKLTLPNRAGYKPCLVMDLWSINPNTGLFDKVGKGKVSDDGTVIETIEGGIRNSSWHFFAPPPPELSLNILKDYNENKVCDVCEATANGVSQHSGAVTQDRALTTYESDGGIQGVSLHYDSLRANPNQIIHVGGQYTTTLSKIVDPRNGQLYGLDKLTTKLTISANGIEQTLPGIASGQAGGATGGENLWSLADGSNRINTSFQADLTNLASGEYEYKLTAGIQGIRANQLVGVTDTKTAKILVVNDSDSVFGSGWNVAGLEKLTINDDQTALLVDGNGSQWLFDPPAGGVYQSPLGDFSTLQQMGDGTFQRTLKDGTVKVFNAKGLMTSSTDTYGNVTQHIYNASGQIQQIVDSVGLATVFNYTGNRVTSIVDPAGRTTTMTYDGQGNLVSVTDPDGTKNQYGYDGSHNLTTQIDKTGQQQTDIYDQFGRVTSVTNPDGTTEQINPIETQGLYSRQQTSNLTNAPVAQDLSFNPTSTVTDANGHVTQTTVNDRGQVVSQIDEAGVKTINTYNADHLVTSQTDGSGNTVNYQYDARGNVTKQITTLSATSGGDLFDHALSVVDLPGAGYGSSALVSASGDINNDGFNDVVTTNGSFGTLSILLGDAQGSFVNTYSIATNMQYGGNNIQQLELKDVNGDGKLDLIAAVPYVSFVSTFAPLGLSNNLLLDPILVYLGQGNGQFAAPQILPLTATGDGFVTGDFNGDGKLDILVRSDIQSAKDNNVYPLVLYAGDGSGNFTEQQIRLPGIDNTTNFTGGLQTLAIDVNKDGKTELVFNLPDRLAVYQYTSDCDWTNTDTYLTDFTKSRQKIISGDLKGDNSTTLVTLGAQELDLLFSQPDGSFQIKKFNPFDNDLRFDGSNKLQIIDVNGDGKTDLVISGTDILGKQSLKIYTLNAAGELIQQGITNKLPLSNTTGQATTFEMFEDLNGSGTPELLLKVSDSQIGVVKNISVLPQVTTYAKSYTYDAKFNQLTSETDELGRKSLYDLDTNTGKVLKTTHIVGQLDVTSGETNDVITSYTYTTKGWLNTVTDALGHVTDYDYDNYGRLVKTTTALGTVDQSVEQYEYNLAGNKTASIDALGHRTSYVYNSMNMLLQSTDALGNTTTYNYDKMGHQTSMTDALGHVTKMTYDKLGRLVSTIDANGGTNTDAYDNNGNLLAVTDALGRVTQYQYDSRNRMIGTVSADGGINPTLYDASDNIVGSIDSLGHKTQKVYDSRNRLDRELDALGNQTKYSYDAANELISTTDALGHTTTYQYDELGRQISTTDALGHVTRTEYDKLGDVTATVDANGNRTEYTYDALNRRIQVKDAQGGLTKTSYDKVGDVLSVTDALNRTTRYAYDALDRQISLTDALNQTSTTSYDAVGNVILTTDALNRSTSYSYDNLNRKISTKDALGQTQSVSYDLVGNVLTQTDELGHVTSFGYDNVDRQTTITDPLGHISSTSYDTQGNVTSTTDSLGNVTLYVYDNDNRKVQVIDAKGGVTKTSYDAVGNVASITDSVGNITTYGYDAIDRLITDTNQLNQTRTRSYDNVGNLTQTVDRNGRSILYSYDTLNRQTAERWLDGSGATVKTFSSVYDTVGHLLTSTNPDSTYTYTYDAVDRTTSIDNTGTVGVPAVKFNYSYDAVGNLLAVNDSINGTSAGITGYTYDLLNRVTQLTQGGTGVQSKRVDMAYNAVNQLTSLSRFSGVNSVADTSYTYDNNQRLIQLSHKKGVSTIASFDYGYDAADKLASTISSVDGTSSYSYDSTNQLTGASHTAQTNEAYSYDANGNRTSGGTVTSANNQLLSDGTYNYTYDGEGNRTRRTEIASGKVTEYVWDYRNRLTAVLFKDASGNVTKTIDYIYDGSNQRIGKRIDGAVTERYVIDRNQIALVFDGASIQTHRYLYGTQIDQVLADETGVSTNWFLADNQGTVKDVVDGNGAVIDHIVYDSFGKVESQSNAGYELRFGYTGREQDNETGLDYYRARYYDSVVGRFISEDPIGFGAGDANLYRYVGNSPVNGTDPSGRQTSTDNPILDGIIIFGTAVGAGIGALKNIGDGINDLRRGNPTNTPNRTPNPQPAPAPTVPPLTRPLPRPTPIPSPSPSLPPFIPYNPNDCNDDKDGVVPIYKAPQIGTADRLLTSGFSLDDFSGNGFNYFAKQKSLADDYAGRKLGYDGRILQVNINKKIYESRFHNYERKHNGNPSEIELEIPPSEIPTLNGSIKFLLGKKNSTK